MKNIFMKRNKLIFEFLKIVVENYLLKKYCLHFNQELSLNIWEK